MQAVTLSDTLTLSLTPSDTPFAVTLSCDDPTLACDDTNLVCRAARALAENLESKGEMPRVALAVELQKRIPMAAGLAGGSADAAATLCGFNELLGYPLSTDALCEIGARLGADIPFCIRSHETGAMTARGIGEILTAAPTLPAFLHLVIACHGEGVSTPWAYRKMDELPCAGVETAEQSYEAFLAALNKGDVQALAAHSANGFERVVLPERAEAARLMDAMQTQGAALVRMSGSGPSVVGMFTDEMQARRCVEVLTEKGIRAVVCRPITVA
jgi:4-diphosphocytidyl-2-C-methyl-D-erythritol kinase